MVVTENTTKITSKSDHMKATTMTTVTATTDCDVIVNELVKMNDIPESIRQNDLWRLLADTTDAEDNKKKEISDKNNVAGDDSNHHPVFKYRFVAATIIYILNGLLSTSFN